MKKKCNKCQEIKLVKEFFKDKNNKTDGHYSICKQCKMSGTYDWRTKNKDKYNAGIREYNRTHQRERRNCDYKRKYGISLEIFEAKLSEQNDGCAICKKSNPSIKRNMAVDHDHKTGATRGILCYGCNRALHALETEELLKSALAYLEKYKQPK